MKDFLNYIIIKHSIIYSIHIHNFRKFLLKACILHIISQNSRTAVWLAFLQSYSCFCSELLSRLLSILLIWNLSLVEPDSTVVALKWCVWMCVPRSLYRQSCHHMMYVDVCGCVCPGACTGLRLQNSWVCNLRSLISSRKVLLLWFFLDYLASAYCYFFWLLTLLSEFFLLFGNVTLSSFFYPRWNF